MQVRRIGRRTCKRSLQSSPRVQNIARLLPLDTLHKAAIMAIFEFGRNLLGTSAATYHTVSQLRCYLMPMSLDPREDRGSVESIADLQKAGMPHPEF